MRQPEDYALALLLRVVRRCEEKAVATALDGARGGRPFAELAIEAGLLPSADLPAYQEAARFLVAGDALRACARPECRTQRVAPPAEGACPKCGGPLMRGILPRPVHVVFDPAIGAQVRRLLQEALERRRVQGRAQEAARLRADGSVGRRPEAELAPREKACTETVVGPYKLLDLVGRGSAAYVYRAADTRDGRTVALKVLYHPPGASDAEMRERTARFRREAELAGQLEHPHIVPVGPLETAGSWQFLAMPFLDGPTLEHVLETRERGGAPFDGSDTNALALALADVARGLHFAHCRNVLHRDVNPRNILCTAEGRALLSDFGSAKLAEGGSLLTADRAVLGALAYASPERLESESRADPRSDVYSLGVVLFRILTGRLPFAAKDPQGFLNETRKGAPRAGSVRAEVPPALEAVAARALAPDPGARFPSALEFAEALTRATSGEVPEPAGAAPARPVAARRVGFGPLVAGSALAFVLGAWAMAKLFPATGAGAGSPADRTRAASERARVAWMRGDVRQAERDFADAIAAGAGDSALRIGRGLAALLLAERHGKSSRAAELRKVARTEFDRIYAADRASREGRLSHAALSFLVEDADTAYALSHKLARENPGDFEPAFLEAWIALRDGAPGLAVTAFHHVASTHPAQPMARVGYALALLADDRIREGVAEARQAASAWPDCAEASAAWAAGLIRAGDPKAALDALGAAAARAPEAVEFQRLRVAAAAEAGRWCEAIAASSEALRLDPASGDDLFQRARLRISHRDPKGGEEDLRSYLQRFPDGTFVEEAKQRLPR